MVIFGSIEFASVGCSVFLYFFKYFDYCSNVHLSYLELVWPFYTLLKDLLGLSGAELSWGPVLSHSWGRTPCFVSVRCPSPAGGDMSPAPRGEVCMLLLILSEGSSRSRGLYHTAPVTWLPTRAVLSLCPQSWHSPLCPSTQPAPWVLPGSSLPERGSREVGCLLIGTDVPTPGDLFRLLLSVSIRKILTQNLPCATFTWGTSVSVTGESHCPVWAYICLAETDT